MVPIVLHLLRACWLPAASFFAGVLNTIAGGGSPATNAAASPIRY
jgi:hypothetical protein